MDLLIAAAYCRICQRMMNNKLRAEEIADAEARQGVGIGKALDHQRLISDLREADYKGGSYCAVEVNVTIDIVAEHKNGLVLHCLPDTCDSKKAYT